MVASFDKFESSLQAVRASAGAKVAREGLGNACLPRAWMPPVRGDGASRLSRVIVALVLLAADRQVACVYIEVDANAGIVPNDVNTTKAFAVVTALPPPPAVTVFQAEPPVGGLTGEEDREKWETSFQVVFEELQGRKYALVYDEPDNSIRLDRSEISEGLVIVHPLEITTSSPDSLFAAHTYTRAHTAAAADTLQQHTLHDTHPHQAAKGNPTYANGWFVQLVRGAAEIHVAPGGDKGRHVVLLISSFAHMNASRKVVHLYAGGGPDVCAGKMRREQGVGEGSGRCDGSAVWKDGTGWDVLSRPRGFTHLEISIDEPLGGDMIPACRCVCVCVYVCV